MASRSSGYSNAAYCNMYDNDPDDVDFSYCTDETFIDDEFEGCREPPLGASGTGSVSGSLRMVESRTSTPVSTPRKAQVQTPRRRQRSFSAPRNPVAAATNTANVLAPMIAQARCNQDTYATEPAYTSEPAIRRSRSAVFCKDSSASTREYREFLGQRGTPSRRTISVGQNGQNQNTRYSVIAAAVTRPHQEILPFPMELESSWRPNPRHCLIPTVKSAANLAIIPPSTRPLLSPPRSPEVRVPSPNKASWASLPLVAPPNNTLSLSGMFLLFTSAVNCLLCFYLLAKLGLQKGRHYYIDFAVISGFAMLVLGFIGVRMGRYDWAPNRNYLAGYMVLSMLDVLLCAVLGLLASDWRPPDWPEVLEVASGAVCGLSALMLLLALGLAASTCCQRPPPDNRVAHSVPSFIV